MANAKNNIILIMCDQLRADALGCYGNTVVKTPNLDRLARRGVTFEQAYSTTPVCVPARYGLLSGIRPLRLGIWDNQEKVPEVKNPLPELIRRQGYAAYAAGKMHFMPPRNHYGFDSMYLSEEIPDYIQDDEYLQFLKEKGCGSVFEPHGKRSEDYYVPQESVLPKHLHSSAWTADQAAGIIETNRNRPFFLFCSFIKPHPPFEPCPEYLKLYQDAALPKRIQDPAASAFDRAIPLQNGYKVNGFDSLTEEQIDDIRKHYYACITQTDEQIGKILDKLDELGLSEDTLILFLSDHGEMCGDHDSFGKRTYFEGSAHIPMLVSLPSRLPSGVRCPYPAVPEDVYATAIEYAGGTELLFDLKEDPDELRNLASQETEARSRLRERLKEYLKDGLPRMDVPPVKPGGFLNQFPNWVKNRLP